MKQINSLNWLHWEQSLAVDSQQQRHFLDNAAWWQGPLASSRRWHKENGRDKVSLLSAYGCWLFSPFGTLICPEYIHWAWNALLQERPAPHSCMKLPVAPQPDLMATSGEVRGLHSGNRLNASAALSLPCPDLLQPFNYKLSSLLSSVC